LPAHPTRKLALIEKLDAFKTVGVETREPEEMGREALVGIKAFCLPGKAEVKSHGRLPVENFLHGGFLSLAQLAFDPNKSPIAFELGSDLGGRYFQRIRKKLRHLRGLLHLARVGK